MSRVWFRESLHGFNRFDKKAHYLEFMGVGRGGTAPWILKRKYEQSRAYTFLSNSFSSFSCFSNVSLFSCFSNGMLKVHEN